MEISGTGFASIAFGYPNAFWGEPQTPFAQWLAVCELLG